MKQSIQLFIGFLFLCNFSCWAQEAPKNFEVGGYIKFLQISSFASEDSLITSQLIHNRVNFDWYLLPSVKLNWEMRNRIFYGENVRNTPNFGRTIDTYDGILDMSIRWVDNEAALIHTQVDRAYLQWSNDKWDIRVGRQRINWGVALTWNPNDVFNAFNFLDFDYEERPGSDAIRIQYFPGIMSHVEISYAPGETWRESVLAGKYGFNYKNYDLQVLLGYFQEDVFTGIGWEGYLGGAGFKGESTIFIPTKEGNDSEVSLSTSLSFDYQWANNMYTNFGVLYNQNPFASFQFQNGLVGGELSPKNLFPSQWSFLTQASGQVHPLVTISGAVLYATELNITAFLPSISYSITEDWDLDLTVQSFFLSFPRTYQHSGTSAFLRIKWSY
ncbi:MAG: DUF1302 family protein [Bacteroidota bacterium]